MTKIHLSSSQKIYIKDGFWRLVFIDTDVWNFCYVLPQDKKERKIDNIELVVPNCLEMGWCESPPFFCTALEKARDFIDTILHEVNLTDHPFEEHRIAYQKENPMQRLKSAVTYTNLIEVFVEDFIAAINNPSLSHLTHF